ncbi:MAG: alpha/beta hydrolase [Candidatus Izemoplasmatales bacterium]|jgi:acetyl esterase/lipase|nr:alpha/beta hydrolase [Candidatus Izemoplasmatales bacterium]
MVKIIMRIAKGLRLAGFIYSPFTNLIPMNKKKMKIKSPSKRLLRKYTYLKREDGSWMKILVKKPKNQKTKVGIFWVHGGGYVTGSSSMAKISMAKHLAKEYVIVSPDYTLGIYKPYPAALNDCYQALLWMRDNAKDLGISPDEIVVGGDSAGGGMAVALSLYARDKGDIKIKCLIPMYPMIDDRMNTNSMIGNKAPVWDERNNRKAWSIYLEGIPEDKVSKYAAPARETDYTNLPPTITFVGSIEPFFDETVTYVENLKKAGIKVAFKLYEGCFHAFDVMVPWSKQAKDAKEFILNNLNAFLKD